MIGNIDDIEADALWFAIGRLTPNVRPDFDEETGDFTTRPDQDAPFTDALYDPQTQIVAISTNAKLSSSPTSVANNFARLLSSSNTLSEHKIRATCSPLKDPAKLIEQIREAEFISSFSATFRRPNPFDANEDFQKPTERLIHATDGAKGKIEISGDALDAKVVSEIVASVAATGDDASATLKLPDERTPRKRWLRGNNIIMIHEDTETNLGRREFLLRIKETFERIRQGFGE